MNALFLRTMVRGGWTSRVGASIATPRWPVGASGLTDTEHPPGTVAAMGHHRQPSRKLSPTNNPRALKFDTLRCHSRAPERAGGFTYRTGWRGRVSISMLRAWDEIRNERDRVSAQADFVRSFRQESGNGPRAPRAAAAARNSALSPSARPQPGDGSGSVQDPTT